MNNLNIIILFFLLAFGIDTHAQNNFKAAVVGGFTAAQLGGDSISGYDKLGFTFGGRLSYALSQRLDLSIDLLYSQRGSRDEIGFSTTGNNTTVLNYLELPVYLSFNDWYIDKEDYYKVGIFGGLSYSNLITAESTNSILSGREGEFKSHDFSARVGVYYAFTKKLTFRTYYSDSFTKILEGQLFNTNSLDSFYWTFRIEYNL